MVCLTQLSIVEEFLARCLKVEDCWRPCFLELLINFNCLFSKCTSSREIEHYIREFLVKVAYIHEDCNILMYGRLTRPHHIVCNKLMVAPKELQGAFPPAGAPNEDLANAKLTFCSLSGAEFMHKHKEADVSVVELILLHTVAYYFWFINRES